MVEVEEGRIRGRIRLKILIISQAINCRFLLFRVLVSDMRLRTRRQNIDILITTIVEYWRHLAAAIVSLVKALLYMYIDLRQRTNIAVLGVVVVCLTLVVVDTIGDQNRCLTV